MRIKSLLFVLCFSLVSSAFATNIHTNTKAENPNQKAANSKAYPGYCEIEIINDSYYNVNVYGTFDDGAETAFRIYRYERPHYISLYYYGYCHDGMYLTITTPYSTVYSDWTYTNSTIRIVPYLTKQSKAEVARR